MAQALSAGNDIRRRLRPMALRLRLRDTLRLASRTLWMALAASALIQLLGRVLPIANLLLLTLIPAALWLLGMIGYLLFQPLPLPRVAQRIDGLLGLRERLATALELGTHSEAGPIDGDQQEDARRLAAKLKPGQVPLEINRRALGLALIPLVIVVASIVLPNPQTAVLLERTAVQQALAKTADNISQAQKQVAQDQTLTPEQRAALEKELADLERKLRENNGNREQALADLSTAEARLQQRIDPNSDARRAAMEQMTRNLQSLSGQQPNQRPSPSDASKELRALADRLASLTPEQRQQAAQSLGQQAAQTAQSDQQLAQSLANAAQALQNNDTASAQQSLQQAAQQADKAAQQQAEQQAAQRSLSQVQQNRQDVAQAGKQNQQAQQGQQNQQGQQGQQNQQSQQNQQGQQNQQNQQNQQGQQGQQGQQNQQGQQGQGQGTGKGQGQQGQQGGGPRPNGQGQGQGGQTNIDPNSKSGNGQGQGSGQGDSVYQPYNPNAKPGDPDYVAGQQGANGQTQVQQGQSNLPGVANQSQVPYEQVLPQYQRAAGEALDQSAIPPHLKDYVRDYFSQLEPNR